MVEPKKRRPGRQTKEIEPGSIDELVRLLALTMRYSDAPQGALVHDMVKAGWGPSRVAELLGTTANTAIEARRSFYEDRVTPTARRAPRLRALLRDASLHAFQAADGKDNQMIVCSIDVAGHGLTLTQSSNVVLLELDWTPAKHDQAEDWCHSWRLALLAPTACIPGFGLVERKLNVSKPCVSDSASDVPARLRGSRWGAEWTSQHWPR